LLCVGSIEPRKNLVRLLEAWGKIQASVSSEIELVVAGANLRDFPPLSREAAVFAHAVKRAQLWFEEALMIPALVCTGVRKSHNNFSRRRSQ